MVIVLRARYSPPGAVERIRSVTGETAYVRQRESGWIAIEFTRSPEFGQRGSGWSGLPVPQETTTRVLFEVA